jgi:L-arabinokinase
VLIVFYISGHGFGHASRDIEVINALGAARTDMREVQIVARTTVPAWLFGRARGAIDIQPIETDTGLIQIDSLRFDERESARQAAAFYRTFDERVDAEARVLRTARADLVVGDIPPLAFAAARRAGVRSMAIGNFTWDWIYAAYPAFEELAPDVIPAIRTAYGTATRALRLPFHGGFEPMAAVTDDIPLIARRSRRDPADTRRLLGIAGDRPVVLASFGAYGAPLPYDAVQARGEFTLLTVERLPPHGLEYPDLVAAADVVLSKPGYGIVSECIANGTALLYASRGRFVEYDVFVAGMPRVLRCREISHEDLFGGRWAGAVAALLAQPGPAERLRVDGAEIAAAEVLKAAC